MGTLTWDVVDQPDLMAQLTEAIAETARTGRVVVIHPNGDSIRNIQSKVLQRGYKVKGVIFHTRQVGEDLHAWAEAK